MRAKTIGVALVAAITMITSGDARLFESLDPVRPIDIARLNDLAGLSVSPDGASVVFQVRGANPETNLYESAWFVLPTDGSGIARRVADGGEPLLLARRGRINGAIVTPPPSWSPDGRWIAYVRVEGGRAQAWRSSIDGRRTERLSGSDYEVGDVHYSRDGQRVLFETTLGRAQRESILASEARNGFLFDDRFVPSYSTAPVQISNENSSQTVRVFDVRLRRERSASPNEVEEFRRTKAPHQPNSGSAYWYFSAVGSPGYLAWTEARDPEQQGGMPPLTLAVSIPDETSPIICAASECTSQRFLGLWWRGNDEVIFATEGGRYHEGQAIYSWRPGRPTVRPVLWTRDKLVGAPFEWRCELANDLLVCLCEGPTQPRRLVSVDFDTGDIETLYDPNPHFMRFDLGDDPQFIEIAQDGVESYGYLTLPAGRQPGVPLPLVVVTYRCAGFLRGGVGDEYPIYAFSAHGFAVLCFEAPTLDYQRLRRMSFRDYGTWLRGDGDPEKQRTQQLLNRAISDLERAGIVDRTRVGLTGLSFGAETVSFALFNMPGITAAITSGAGYEPTDYYLLGTSGQGSFRRWGLSPPEGTIQRWREFSLGLNAQHVEAPLLLNVADREMLLALFPITQLRETSRSVEMFVFPDEYHVKWQPAHRLAIYNRNIDWMNFWLRGVESGLTGDATQYERWRAMRENQCRLFGPGGAEHRDDIPPPWYCRPGALDAAARH